MKAALTIQSTNFPAYPVYIERGLEAWSKGSLPEYSKSSSYFLITERKLPRSLVTSFLRAMRHHFPLGQKDPRVIFLEGGERAKHFRKLEAVYEKLIKEGIDRQACLLALGGGVVGDFCGFTAASLLRGLDFVQIPSTLLAAVDSSVGGKVGVNLKHGKNMVGSFHHPKFVYLNTDFLNTLSEREWICGIAEMLKHGLIEKTGKVLEELFQNSAYLRKPQAPEFSKIVHSSIAVKAQIVSIDEKEKGKRMALNLGHTTAHALESLTRYRRFSHGEAVSRGLVTALLLSRNLKGLAASFVEEFLQKMQSLNLPQDTAKFKAPQVYEHMRYDKKGRQGQPRFVLLEAVGEVFWDQEVSMQDFTGAWEEQAKRFG